MNTENRSRNKLVVVSAWTVLAGAMLSGPVGTGLLVIFAPQPAWRDAATFILNYRPVQSIPFLLGFVLMFGSCLLTAASARLVKKEADKVLASLALVAVGVYPALIALNYVAQTAYVPMLVKANQEIVGYFTMTNPASICWGVEMFGYLFQGFAFWLVAPAFEGGKFARTVRFLLFVNLLMSVAGAVAAVVDIAWAMTPFGLVMFVAWNLVVAALMVFIILNSGQAARGARASPDPPG